LEPKIRRSAFEWLGRFDLKEKVRLLEFRVSHLEKVAEK
jgi:hypothetical protein